MKVLITGGTGFIGSRLALKCAVAGDQVTVLGQENTPAEAANKKVVETKGAKVILASVTDPKLSDLLKGFDIVFHLAAAQHEMNVPDQRFWDVNVKGTKNILEASFKAGVRRFVHGSTIGVYGAALDGMLHENSATKPDNIYGITKLEGEKAVLSFREKVPVTVVRISETYGPGDHRLLKLFKAIEKKAFFMIGKGTNSHHLIYIDDLCEALLKAAFAPKAEGETFVLAGRDVVTTNEMVSIIAAKLGTDTWRFHAPLYPFIALATVLEKTLRPLNVQPPLHRRRLDFFKKSFAFSQDKTRNVIGFNPRVSFSEGISSTCDWYREMGYL
jgi:nucleoside-diphosphate-sugar epimerase